MNRYRAYMDRARLPEGAHRRTMDALEAGQRPTRRRRRAYGALAACCTLAVLAGAAGLIRWTGLPAPMAAVTPAASGAGIALPPSAAQPGSARGDNTLVVDDPFDGQNHGFFNVPALAFPDCTGGPAITADLTALPEGYFEEALTAEEIIHALGGSGEVPWELLWAGFGLDGTVIYDGQGAVWLAYITGENGDTALSLCLSPDDLPPMDAIYQDVAEEDVNGVTVTTYCLETEEDGTTAWAYHVQMLAGDTGIDFTCTSPDRDQADWLASVFARYAAVPEGILTTRGLEPDEIPEWRSAALTLEEARAEDLGAYLPGTPAGFTFDWAWRELGQGRDWLSVSWGKGMDNFTARVSRPEAAPDCLDPADTARYDVNLYSIPWADSVPDDIMFGGFQDPVFRAEDMTPEIVAARTRWEDQDAGDIDGWRCSQFSVWHADAGVLVTYAGRGIAPEALAALILPPA